MWLLRRSACCFKFEFGILRDVRPVDPLRPLHSVQVGSTGFGDTSECICFCFQRVESVVIVMKLLLFFRFDSPKLELGEKVIKIYWLELLSCAVLFGRSVSRYLSVKDILISRYLAELDSRYLSVAPPAWRAAGGAALLSVKVRVLGGE